MGTRHEGLDGALAREMSDLKRRLSHLERSRQLSHATIDAGTLRVAHGGSFRIENLAGDTILEASETDVGIDNLRVGNVSSLSVPTRGDSTETLVLYVDPVFGDDTASGKKLEDGTIEWLASVQVAADMIPDVWHGHCTIYVVKDTQVSESVTFKGIQGGGLVYIKPCGVLGGDEGRTNGGPNTGKIDWVGTIHMTGINIPAFTLDNVYIVDDGSEGGGGADQLGTVTISAADYVEIWGCRINANSLRANSVYYTNNSTGQVTSCDRMNNATAEVVRARRFSFINVGQSLGRATYGLRASSGSRIVANNEYPTGSTSNTITDIGGTVTLVGGAAATTGTVNPTQTTTTTYEWTSTGGRSWGDKYGWRTDTQDVYQGDYGYGTYRGLWFFNHADIRSKLSEKAIERVEIYISRRAVGGVAGDVDHDFYMHGYGSQPSGKPLIVNSFDGPDLSWGQASWMTVPVTVGRRLRDNDAKGIAIHKTSRGGYSICSKVAKIRIRASG